ncbi:MAG: RCC1 repeat- and reductase domain-containing protein [Acidimicrobiales bacterium]
MSAVRWSLCLVLGVLASSVLLGSSCPVSGSPSSSHSTDGSGRAVVRIAAGGWSGYALLGDGQVWAWGDDLEGQIGVAGQWYQTMVPVEVGDLGGAIAIAGGQNTGYAVLRDGSVWAWGDDSQDELGAGDQPREVPVQVRPLSKIVALDAGAFSVYALRRDGTVWAWGDNGLGQLGTGDPDPGPGTPHELTRLRGVTALAGGASNGYALLRDGTVWAWGDNSLGQLGVPPCASPSGPLSTCLFSNVPVQVPGIAGAVALASGFDTAYALLGDGTVWAWGDNNLGQLGSGTHHPPSDTAVRVRGLDQVVAIAAGSETGYALDREGNLWAWGYGAYGQLGDASATNSDVPVRVRKLSHVVEVAGGGDMAYALDREGNLWAWGYGAYGQLGNDNLVSLDVPTQVVGLPNG